MARGNPNRSPCYGQDQTAAYVGSVRDNVARPDKPTLTTENNYFQERGRDDGPYENDDWRLRVYSYPERSGPQCN